jgi:hypothetical protein
LARSRVVIDEVQLLVGWHYEVGVRTARAGQLKIHITGYARSTVWDGNRGIRTRYNALSHVAGDGLLKERTQVTVGGDTPRAGLFARTNQFKSKVRAVRCH